MVLTTPIIFTGLHSLTSITTSAVLHTVVNASTEVAIPCFLTVDTICLEKINTHRQINLNNGQLCQLLIHLPSTLLQWLAITNRHFQTHGVGCTAHVAESCASDQQRWSLMRLETQRNHCVQNKIFLKADVTSAWLSKTTSIFKSVDISSYFSC